jgi:hypothetical protein
MYAVRLPLLLVVLLLCGGGWTVAAGNSDFCTLNGATLAGTITLPTLVGGQSQYYPIRLTGNTAVSSNTVPPAWTGGGPGCTGSGGISSTADSPADVYLVNIGQSGTYSFHVTSNYCVSTGCPPVPWNTFLFLADRCGDPTSPRVCNNRGYGWWNPSSGLDQNPERSDLTVTLPVGSFYLVVTGVDGAAGPYSLWAKDEAFPFGEYNYYLNPSQNPEEVSSLDSLDALFVALTLMTPTAVSIGYFDVAPLETLDAAEINAYNIVTQPALVFPIGDGAVDSTDSLDMLFLALNRMNIPTGSPECLGACGSSGCCNPSSGACQTQLPDNTLCGANDATCVNCAALGLYCYANACEKCDSNTCPNGCCDYSASTGSPAGVCRPGFTDSRCGHGSNSCSTCDWLASGTECDGQTCAPITLCDVTFSLTGAKSFCSAEMSINYPDGGSGVVFLTGINNGWIDSAQQYQIGAQDDFTREHITFITQGYPAAVGPGSFAVMHFAVNPAGSAVDPSTFSVNSVGPFWSCTNPPQPVTINSSDYTIAVTCSPGSVSAASNCDLTVSLTGYDQICSANMTIPYPAGVSLNTSVNNGISAGSLDSSYTITPTNGATSVSFSAVGSSGARGPGSIAVLHFSVPAGYAATQSDFVPTAAQFKDCNSTTITPQYVVGLSCH